MNKKILTIFPLLFLVCSCSNTSGNTTTPIVNELLDNINVDDFDYFHHIGRYDLNNSMCNGTEDNHSSPLTT